MLYFLHSGSKASELKRMWVILNNIFFIIKLTEIEE